VITPNVHDRRDVAETLRRADAGYVRAPDVVGIRDVNPLEEVGIDPVPRAGLFVDRLDAHPPHEGPDMEAVDDAHEFAVPVGERDRL